MFNKIVTVVKSVTEGGKTTTETTRTVTSGIGGSEMPRMPDAEFATLLAQLDKLLGRDEQQAEACGKHKPGAVNGKPKSQEVKKSNPPEAQYPPDSLAHVPAAEYIADLGQLHVIRFKGRYYVRTPGVSGCHALDTLKPCDGQK